MRPEHMTFGKIRVIKKTDVIHSYLLHDTLGA
jgi:hypothetical protein